MADPLSISVSIIALLQASATVVKYIKSAKDANEDITALKVEVINVRGLLFSLKDLLPDPESEEETLLPVFKSLGGQDGPFKQFEAILEKLITQLQPKEGLKKAGQVLFWHFKKEDIRNLINVIERYKTLFSLALQNDQVNLTRLISGNIDSLKQDTVQVKMGVLDLQKSLEDDQRREVVGWLSSVDVLANHEAACKKHEPTTGNWFIGSPDFAQWKSDPDGFVWLHGFAGCGKTVLCSTIIQETKLLVEADLTRVLAYFYFDFRDKEKQNVPGFLRSLIAQISNWSPILPDNIKELYNRSENQKPPSDIRVLMKILKSILAGPEQVYIIADALDECTEREDLLEVLSEIAEMKSKKLHILVTSRQERDILEGLEAIVTRSFGLGGSKIDNDIAVHVHSQVAEHPKLRKWPDTVKADIEEKLVAKAQGMFRWVFCQLNTLKTCRKESTLREKLEQLPKDLDETYDRILQSIAEEDADEAFAALQWLTYSERPLYLDELAEAVVLGPDKCSLDNRDRLLDPYEVLHICSSLVVLGNGDAQNLDEDDEQGRNGNEEDEKVQPRKKVSFAHFSVKEYLLSERIRSGPASRFSVSASAAHAFIGQTCLSYLLNFDKSDSLPANLRHVFPLIGYSAQHWPYHVRFSEEYQTCSGITTTLTLKLINSKNSVIRNWLRESNPDRNGPRDQASGIGPPLYYASILQLPTIVKALIEGGADVNGKGGYLGNALSAAFSQPLLNAAEDQRMVVALLLLDNGANIEAKTDWGATPLHVPAFKGDVAPMRLLLDRGADIEVKSDWGGTALYGAVVNGYEEATRLLLDRGADIEAKAGRDGTGAFFTAIEAARKEMLQLLLERGSNIEERDNKGCSALHLMALRGNNDAMKLLLEKGADITAKDDNGGTALHYASLKRMNLNDKKEVIHLLLEKGASPQAKDNNGQTALHLAALSLKEELVRLLIENGADVTVKDDSGRTALHYANLDESGFFDSGSIKALEKKSILLGSKEMVQQLVEKGADVTARDSCGQTALHYATTFCDETVKEDIIGILDSRIDSRMHRRMKTVELLLEHGADPTAKDNNGRAALDSTAIDGSKELAQGLELDNEDCDD